MLNVTNLMVNGMDRGLYFSQPSTLKTNSEAISFNCNYRSLWETIFSGITDDSILNSKTCVQMAKILNLE